MAIFHAMAENAVDGMALTTLEGVITYANPADHALFGYDLEGREMVGLPLPSLFSENSRKVMVEEAIPQALDGANWQGEVRGIRKDGTQFGLLATVFAIRDERGDPIALTTVLRDITERKRAEAKIQRRLQEMTLVNRVTTVIASAVDMTDALHNVCAELARFLQVPQAGFAILNPQRTAAEVIADHHPPDSPSAMGIVLPVTDNPSMAYVLKNRAPLAVADAQTDPRLTPVRELMRQRNVQSILIVPILVSGEVIGTLGFDAFQRRVFSDSDIDLVQRVASQVGQVLIRKQAEEALRASEAKYRELVQNANSIILRLDTQGRITFCNEFAQSFFGYAEDEILGQSVVGTIVPERETSGRDLTAMIQDIVQNPEQYTTNENENMRRNGERVWVAWTNKAIFDDDGRISEVLCIGSDVTERRRVEASLERRAVQLQAVAEVSRTTTSVLDPDELLGQVVDLVRERFDLYYVGLFLVDETGEWTGEPGRWAVLRAGTGEAGRKMLEAGHKLEVGGESMIGWCIANTQARIALDVGEEAVRFDNPLLPKTRSEMALPLVSRGQIIGAMTIQSTQPAAFSEEDIALLQTMADQLANAIENARLFEEALARTREVTALSETGRKLASTLELDAVLDSIMDACLELFQVQQACFIMMDEDDYLRMRRHRGLSEEFVRSIVGQPGEGFFGKVYQSGEAILVKDAPKQLDPATAEAVLREGVTSFVHVPVKVKGETVAVMNLTSSREDRRFSERDLERLSAFADQAAIAIENARLFEETKANLEEITFLHRRYLQEAWSEFLKEETGRERAGYMYDQGTISPARAAWGPEIGLAAQHGDTIALSDMADALQGTVEEVGAVLRASPTQSALAVPLKVRGQVIGALDFYETDRARDWSAEDIAMVETVANQVALAVENARAYEELQKTAEQLEEMDRLKTQFLANMSHELRTPLNSIIGFSRVILKGIDGPITEQQRTDLTSIYNNGQHLLGMINDILDISKIEAGKMELVFEPVDVQQIISGVVSTAVALVKDKPIELRQEVDPTLPIIRADGTRVRQVVLNLLSNAAKFTEEGEITLRAWADEDQITISVKDTGIGISPENQTTIFEEFRQVDASTTRRTGGTGLGLAISRHFVEMHNGRIWVESEPGVGSTFTFTLPMTGPAPVAESELAALTIDPSRKLILAVEDDEGAVAIYKRYLEKQGYQVVGLNQGEQAVRWATELSPCSIILDVLLSGKDGWAVLGELKSSRETHQIPVIICTVVDGEEARGLSLGAADYLVKPILEEDLLQSLQRLEKRQRI
jgi:PAS domain S-box-containing protein